MPGCESCGFGGRDILPYLLVSPQTLHPYVYVSNNPVNYVDPLGLCKHQCPSTCRIVNTSNVEGSCWRIAGPPGVCNLFCRGIGGWIRRKAQMYEYDSCSNLPKGCSKGSLIKSKKYIINELSGPISKGLCTCSCRYSGTVHEKEYEVVASE